MRKSRTLNLGTGTFVVLGFAALFFLTTQTTSRGVSFASPPQYQLTAKFDNVGDLKNGSPVSMAGVNIGRVESVALDAHEFKAVVTLLIEQQFDKIPDDSDASIQTAGLLGGKYVGIGPGGSETYLRNGGQITFTQSAIVLESLVNKFFANFASKGDDAKPQTGDKK